MSEFSSIANLEIRPTGMDAARREIERELGDIEVGVSGGSNRPTGRQPRDPQTGQFREQRGTEQRLVELLDLANERNELLEELVDGGGGGGGGGFGSGAVAGGVAARGGGLLSGALGTAGAFGGLLAGGAGIGLAGGGLLDQLFPEARGTGNPMAGERVEPGEPIIDVSLNDIISGIPLELGTDDLINAPYEITREDIMQAPPSGREGRREFSEQANSVSVDVTNNVQVEPTINTERQRFEQTDNLRNQVEPIINTELRRFQQRLEQQLGSGTNPRTTSSGGGGGTTGGGRFRT